MATEAETSEPIAAKKMEAATENICSQFGKVVNKASLEESTEVEDRCSFPSETVDYSTRVEGPEVAQSLKNGIANLNKDGKFSSLENDSSLEASSPARQDSAEIPKASQDNVDRIKPILIKTGILENERIDVKDEDVSEQLEKDKPWTETDDMKELAPEMKHEELDFEPTNADDNMGGNPIEQIVERLAGQYEDIKEEEVSPDHTKTIGGEPIEDVPEDKVTEEDVREPTVEKDVVTDHSKKIIKEEPTKDGNEENEVVEGLEIVGAEDIGVPIIKEKDVPDLSTPIIVDEPTKNGQEEDKVSDGLELAGSELTREKDGPFHGRTTIGEEPNNNGLEENKVTEELETVGEDTYTNEPTIKEDAIPEYSTKSIGEESMKHDHEVEKVIDGLDIVAADKDIGEPTMEEYVIPDNSTTTIQEKPIEDGYKEEKVTVGLETPAADKNIGEPINEEDVAPEHSKTTITEDGHEEDKVTKGLEVAYAGKDIKEPMRDEKVALDNSTTTTWEESIKDGDEKYKISEGTETIRGEDIGETLIKEDVPKHSTTTVEEEQINGGHEEDKVNEGFKIVDEGKDIVEPMIEEDVVQSHSTTTTRDEPTEGSQEDKIVNKPEVIGSDKDFDEPIIENDVLESSMMQIDEKPIENADKEDKVMEGFETTGKDKDIEEPIIKKDVVLDHSTTTITEKLIQETNNDDKKMEGSETSDANKETDNPIIEEDVLPEQPTTTTGQELINDDKEKYKVTEGLEIPHADKGIGEPIKEEDVVVAHSRTTIKEEPIEDGHEEDKVIKGLQVDGAGKDIMEPIIDEDFVPDHYTTTREEEPIKDIPGKDMVIKESKIIDVEDFGEPITEKYVPEPYTTNIEEEQTEDDHEEDKIMHEPIIISADKDFGDSIKDKYVPQPSATTNEGERFEDDHEEDKVIEAQETASPDKDSGEPVIDEGVQDHSRTTITEQPTEDSREEDQIIDVSKVIGDDKDLGNPITDKYVPEPSTKIIEGKRTEEDHEQHKVIGGQETTSADKDNGEPIIEEGIQDHSKTTVTEQPTDDCLEEDQIINQSKTIDADKDFGDPIKAKNVPQPSTTTTIKGEQTKNDHEQDKVIEGQEITCADKDSEEPVTEKVVQDHSITITKEQSIEDNQEDKGSQIIGADKDCGDPNIDKCSPEPSTTNIEEERTKDNHEEDQIRAIEGQETTSADKDSGELVREEDVQDHSTTTIGEHPTEESQEEDQIMHETETIGADKNFGDPIKDKYVPEPSATTKEEERTEDGHEEDKVIEAQETSSPDKDSGEPVIEEGFQDQSTTAITEQPTEDSQEDQINDVSKIIGANKGFGDPITDNYVPEPSTTIIEGKRTEDDHEQDKVTEGQETTSADKDSEEPIIEEGGQDCSKTTLREQPTEDSQEVDQIINESKIIDADGDPIKAKKIPEPSTTIIEGGRTEEDHEEDKVTEGQETTCADMDSGEPIREKSVQDHSTTIAKEQSIEDNQEDKESQIFGAEKDFGDQIIEKCFPEPSTTTIEDERTEEDKIRAIKGQETRSLDKYSGEPIIEEGVQAHSTTTIREQQTQDSQEEDKGSKVIGTDEDFGDRITEKYVPELYTTTIEEERTEDGYEEDKVIEGQETTNADKDSGETVVEEGVQFHSTTSIREQPTEDCQEEDKIIKGSKTIDVDKDFGDTITENYVPSPSATTIEDEQTEDDREQDQVAGQETTSEDKETGEPIIEKDVVPDHFTTVIREELIQDFNVDDKIMEGSKTSGANEATGNLIIEDDVLEHSTATIGQELIKDIHEEDKVSEGLETAGAKKDTGKPIIEEDISEHSTTATLEEPIKHGGEEDKVHKELKTVSGDEAKDMKIIEDDAIVGLYQKSSGEVKTKNISQDYEVGEELAVTEAGMDVVEQIIEDATIADLPTVLEKEEATEGNLEDKSEAEKQKGETEEFDFSMKSISGASDSIPKEDKINFQDEEKQHMNLHPDSVSEARVGEIVQNESSQDLNDTSTELNFGTTGMTEKVETENIKKEENLDKSQDADNTKETSQEELIQKESSETFDEASSLVPLASEEQINEKIVEYFEGIDECQHNPSLTKETKGSSSNATESEGTKLVDLPEGLYIETSVNHFRTNTYENEQGYTKNLEETSMDKTIQTEVIDNGEDQWTQNEEVEAFGDPASTEQNLKSLNLTGETEHLAVVGQHKHADNSDTIRRLLEEPAKGVLEIKIYGEDGDMPKVEEHSAESFEMSKEPEFDRLSEQEKIIDEEITLIQKSETRSMQTIATEESGLTKELGHNNVEHDDIEARTNKEQHSNVIFDTDSMESDLTSGRKIVEDGDGKDQNNTFSRDDEDGKSWIDDKKEQTYTELEPVMEVEAEIHTSGVRPGTSAEIRNEEVCDERGRTDITAIAKVKEEDCILRDINSVHNEEETIPTSHEEDKTDSSNLDGKIQPELWYADKEITQDAKENPRTEGEVTVCENSHKDEKVLKYQKAEVFESPELAGDSRDAVVIDKNDVDETHFTVCVGQEAVQQSLNEDEQEKTEKEVCLELDATNASDHTRTHIIEVGEAPDTHFTEFRADDKVRENFQEGDERNNVKEEVHERLDATGGDKADDKQKLPVLPAEQTSTEYSPEAEVYELETAAAEEGARYKSTGNGAGTKIPADLVGEQTTNLSSQETKMETNTQEVVKESDLESIIGQTASTKETEMVNQDDAKDLENIHNGFIDAEAPLEETIKMESSDKLNYTSTEHDISEEQIVEKTNEKTENTDKHYQISFAMPLTEKLSTHEAKPEGQDLVNATDLSAIETFAMTVEEHGASSQAINVEDVKLREISNFDGSLTDHMLAAENSEKDEAEQEKSDQAEQENFEIPVETASQIVQSEEKDVKTLPWGEIIARNSSSDDILEGKAQESPVSVSDKQDTIGMEPEMKDEAPTEDENIDKKMGAYLVAKGEGETNMKAEECMRHEENSEMGIENKEKNVSIPEFGPEHLLTEPKDDDVILDTQNITELKPINGNRKLQTQIPSLEENKAGNEELFCTFSDKLETMDTYAKTETNMLEPEENHVKKLDQNLEESKKETVEVEEIILEVKAMEHIEEINEPNSTTRNLTLLQNLKAVDSCEKFKKATESVDSDQSNEPLLETEKREVVKHQVIMNNQTAIIVNGHTIGQSVQEDERENKNLNEERSNDNSDVSKPIKDTILNEEMQHRIEKAQKSENIEEEADKKFEVVDKEIAKENAEAVFLEEKIEPTQLENLEKIIDNIHITHSSADEASLASCEQYKDASEGSVEGLDTISVGDGTVEESPPDQKDKGVKEARCESKDDQKQERAEVNQIMDKETLADQFGSSSMVLLERGIKEEDLTDKTQTVLVTNCKDRTRKLDDPPIKIASYEGEAMEVSKHLEEESDLPITKMSENRTGPKSETDPEDFLGIENSSDLAFVTSIMSSKEILHTGEELPINKSDTSCLTEASQQEMQGKEGHSTEDEKKQEMEIVEKPIQEMSLSTEESGKNIKHETPLAEMPKECAEKTNELNIQERICTNKEGETQVRQLDTPDEMAEKQIFPEVDSIDITDKKNPISGIEIPSMPASPVKKSLEKTEVYEENHADAQGHELEMNNVECEADERKHNLGEKTTTGLNSSEEEKVPFHDLLHESKRATQEMVRELEDGTSPSNQAEIGNKEMLTAATSEEQITDENDEEGKEREDDDGEKKDDSGSDAPVMVEASRDIVVKTTPKKSHNILSGVGSKVKHSISKVKKAITGKSSHHKQLSPK